MSMKKETDGSSTEGKILICSSLWRYVNYVAESSKTTPTSRLHLDVDSSLFDTSILSSYIKSCCAMSANKFIRGLDILHDAKSIEISLNRESSEVNDEIWIDQRAPIEHTHDDSSIELEETKEFVQAMIADFSVCPFTNNADKAGVPRGLIRYKMSNAQTIEEAYYDFWMELYYLSRSTVKEISTVLLIFSPLSPLFKDFAFFTEFTETLDSALSNSSEYASFDLSGFANNVYFHPHFNFQDKEQQNVFLFDADGNICGTSADIIHPISYARRSPYPVINILRSKMVESAQKGIPEGKIFHNNKLRLDLVGSSALQKMLDTRDWSSLPREGLSASDRVLKKTIEQAQKDSMSGSSDSEPCNTEGRGDGGSFMENLREYIVDLTEECEENGYLIGPIDVDNGGYVEKEKKEEVMEGEYDDVTLPFIIEDGQNTDNFLRDLGEYIADLTEECEDTYGCAIDTIDVDDGGYVEKEKKKKKNDATEVEDDVIEDDYTKLAEQYLAE